MRDSIGVNEIGYSHNQKLHGGAWALEWRADLALTARNSKFFRHGLTNRMEIYMLCDKIGRV
jgi:hypothetical protein